MVELIVEVQSESGAILPTILKADAQSAGLWVRNPTVSPHPQQDLLSGVNDVRLVELQTSRRRHSVACVSSSGFKPGSWEDSWLGVESRQKTYIGSR